MEKATAGTWVFAVVAWFVASIAYRLISGKGVFARRSANAVFTERWASGRSGTGLVSRLSTARNCLQVQVTPHELVVTPHFPFALAFVPELYDLDKHIAVKAVRKGEVPERHLRQGSRSHIRAGRWGRGHASVAAEAR